MTKKKTDYKSWSYQKRSDGGYIITKQNTSPSNSSRFAVPVAYIPPELEWHSKDRESNAQLISLAPQLFSALQITRTTLMLLQNQPEQLTPQLRKAVDSAEELSMVVLKQLE